MKKLSKILAMSLVGALMVGALAGCGGDKENNNDNNTTPEQASLTVQDGKFIIGLDDSLPPMGFRDKDNNLVGFDIDLAKEVAKRLGLEFVGQPIDWDSKELELKNKNIDCIWNGMTATEDRKASMTLSKPYIANEQIIVVAADSDIKGRDDLAGKVVALQKGSSAVEALNKLEVKDSIKEVQEFAENISALTEIKNGRVDAVIVDSVVGNYYVADKTADFKVLDDSLAAEEYAIGFLKGNTALCDKVNEALDAMMKDGTFGEISNKWFGKDVSLTK